MKKKGFTLIELLAVVLILAIIALILIPLVSKIVESARDAANKRSVEGYIGDLNYAIMEKVLLEKNDKVYDGEGITEFSDLTYNDIIECDFYNVKDGVVQYAEACTKKDGSWGAYYNYGLGMGAWKVRVLGKSADITGITVQDTVASRDDNTFTVSISSVRKANIVISSEENVTYVIKKNNNVVNNEFLTLKNGDNTFEVTVTSENGKNSKKYILIVAATNVPTAIEGESILQILNDEDLDTGTYTFTANGQNYPVHMYVYSGNQNWTDSTIPMKNGFGDQYDVAASASTNATRMVIVKVNGDLTNSSTIKPYSTNYGGPKGFMLYVTGKLTNNGTIDNSHGAKASGQDVYLWKNADGTYEYIPAAGGSGGTASTSKQNGKPGTAGTARSTAGGGSGGGLNSTSIAGGTGTSYKGGVGGNGITNSSVVGTGATKAGGLLIIYSNEYENTGTISATGTKGGSGQYTSGGSSGGGSINIFTNQETNIDRLGIITNTRYNEIKGTTTAAGGATVKCTGSGSSYSGGAGGTGATSIGEIRNGQYYDLKEIIEQDKQEYTNSVTIRGDSILSILQNNDLNSGYYYFSANDTNYPVHLIVLEGNQVIEKNTTYGDAGDVGTASKNAQNMVIVKVKGDYTVNSGVIVGPYYDSSYGGPKGFMLYVTGKLTNNGTIDNSHGAKAAGEDVYLWKNVDGTYEYIPAAGGSGGTASTSKQNGKPGTAGTARSTAGGGSGGGLNSTSIAGGTGTSYKGGVGGNGITNSSVVGTGATKAGGLLIIYSNEYENTGTISATGTKGGSGQYTSGGSSGGGSINIFYQTMINKGTASAAGGATVKCTGSGSSYSGGAGGAGTVNIGRIVDGTYIAN